MSGVSAECEIDLSELEADLDKAQHDLVRGLPEAVTAAASEGLTEALRQRRYQNRTGRLSGTAIAYGPLTQSAREATAEIHWPMRYASMVDQGGENRRAFGFAGDAATKAERVLMREAEEAIARAQDRLR